MVSMSSGSLTATTRAGFAKCDRNHFETTGVFGPDLFDYFRRNDHRRDVDPIHVRLSRQSARNIGVGNDSILDQEIDHVVFAI